MLEQAALARQEALASIFFTFALHSCFCKGDIISRLVANSLCFGAYVAGVGQVGFARLVTDRATFAYLADVFVLAEHRGRGVSKRLMEAVVSHPDLQGLRRWLLFTRDAHSVYAPLGWSPLTDPARVMLRHFPDVYGAVPS